MVTNIKKTDSRHKDGLFIISFILLFGFIGHKMGFVNMIQTILNTSYDLLINVCFYIMAISVITGGLGELLFEFNVIEWVSKKLSRLMRPIYNLPGAAAWSILMCYLSDNPAVLTLAKNEGYKNYFKNNEFPAITNLGTSFGMGLIVTTTIMGMDISHSVLAAVVGNVGAILGSVVSVRIMLKLTKGFKIDSKTVDLKQFTNTNTESINRTLFERFINSLLDGGMKGVDLGVQIIPGVLIICSFVLLITNGVGPNHLYDGSIGQGVPILHYVGDKLDFIIKPIFGFKSSQSISVVITSLGSAGAAIALIPSLIQDGLVTAKDLSVFTSIVMCWSGYLSTHIAMMSSINARELTNKALISHTIGGVFAGFASNMIFNILIMAKII